jgi:nucleoside-diphosphate-sugar epimerase
MEDVVDFYERLIRNREDCLGQIIHCAGNVGDQTVTNLELAEMILKIAGRTATIRQEGYEPGELVDGRPISFRAESRSRFWHPKHTLRQGLSTTYDWFKENRWRYQ